MAEPASALLIDMDGVLYQGEQAIPGAVEALDWLNAHAVPHLFLTNTTSRPRTALSQKLARMGMRVEPEQILTPPVAATRWLNTQVSGAVALFVPPATLDEFEGFDIHDCETDAPVAAVVIGDYGERWNFDTLNHAFRLLMQDPRPALIALGMTRYWRAEDGLRLDTAPFVAALEQATDIKAVVLGKPAGPFFQAALQQLGAPASRTWMVGDDIRGDIGGAQKLGIRGVLVKTGKFRLNDLNGDIHPATVLDSFADLPDWWQKQPRV